MQSRLQSRGACMRTLAGRQGHFRAGLRLPAAAARSRLPGHSCAAPSSLPETAAGFALQDVSFTGYSEPSASSRFSPPPVQIDQQPLGLSAEERVAAALTCALIGSALGAPHDGDRAYLLQRRHPEGVSSYWPYDLSGHRQAAGTYTGDGSALLATARSLVRCGGASSSDQADELMRTLLFPASASASTSAEPATGPSPAGVSGPRTVTEPGSAGINPEGRRMGPYLRLVVGTLAGGSGVPLGAVPYLAEKFIQTSTPRRSNTTSDRPEREPYGPGDHGAAARAAPIGLAYRDAPVEALRAAVEECCLFSHSHPSGLEGAQVVAAAAARLSRHTALRADEDSEPGAQGPEAARQPGSASQGPRQLLMYLLEQPGLVTSQEMRAKLELMLANLFQVQRITSWRAFYSGAEWNRLVQVHARLSHFGMATQGTEAAAVALWALVTHWERPRQAMRVAVALGGTSSVQAQITGALLGALHGDSWLPHAWWQGLEPNSAAREEAAQLGRSLAALQVHRQ